MSIRCNAFSVQPSLIAPKMINPFVHILHEVEKNL